MPATGSLYLTRSKSRGANGKVYEYAYLRYDVKDGKKGRWQPVTVASLGRYDDLEEWRARSLVDFLREWVRKDSSLPFDALKRRFEMAEPVMRILCSRDFGFRFLFEQAWRELGYGKALAEVLADSAKAHRIEIAIFAMVLVQLLAPQSKRGMREWADIEVFFPEAKAIELGDMYEALDVLAANYDLVEKRLAEALRERGAVPVEFAQDTTTIVCHVRYDDAERAEIEKQRQDGGKAVRKAVVNDPPLRMRGHSKEKRADLPQVKVNAVLGNTGLIVHHETVAGNQSDATLVEPAVKARQNLGYAQVSWTSDAAFNSVRNREVLRAADFEFVSAEGKTRSRVVKEVLSRAGRYAPHPDKPEVSFKCVVAEAIEEREKGKLDPQRLYVVRRNAEEERYALQTLERHLAKIEAVLANGGEQAEKLLHHRTYKRYVRRDARKKDAKGRPAGPVILDRAAIEWARHTAGKSVIATDALDVAPLVADDLYRMIYDLERVFRELKSTLKVGPVRHRRADRIRGHVMVAVMAHNLGAWLASRTGRSIEAIRRLLANLRVQEVELGGARFWQRTELEPEQEELFTKLGYDPPPERFTVEMATRGTN